MATTKSMKIQTEIDKVKAKISEQQARLKELEQKKLEAENSEIVDIVRGMSIPLQSCPCCLKAERRRDFGTKCPEVRGRPNCGKRRKTEYETISSFDSGALCRCFVMRL